MHIFIDVMSLFIAALSSALVAANVFVVVATSLGKRRCAMRILGPTARFVMMLRLTGGMAPIQPDDRRQV
jgi:hypothetical protein